MTGNLSTKKPKLTENTKFQEHDKLNFLELDRTEVFENVNANEISGNKKETPVEKHEHIENNPSPEKFKNNGIPADPEKAVNSETPSTKKEAEVGEKIPSLKEKSKESENAKISKMADSEDKTTSPGAKIWNEMYPGFMTEEDALRYKPCEDFDASTSPNKTKLFLTGQNGTYKLKDRIQLTIVAYDHYGNPKTEGGDLFLATIKTEPKNASAPGVVTDLHNGSYEVEFDAVWTGKAIIRVILAYTKQLIAATMRFRIKHVPAEYMVAGYDKNNISDTGYCHWNNSMLIYEEICKGDHPVRPYVCKDVGLTPERREICNFTSINSGTPWYCLKPLKKELGCEDWKYISRHNDFDLPGASKCELKAYKRIHLELSTNIEVNIEPQFDGDSRATVKLPSNPCSLFNKTALWHRRKPTGFYYNGIWHLRHCKGVKVDKIADCMKNKNYYFIGDSTLRQWYYNLVIKYDCEQITEKWTVPKWYKKSKCRNVNKNFTVTFSMHNIPLFIPTNTKKSIVTKSISSYIDDIADDENAVLVFHMFGHLTPYHPDFYKLEMKIIRNSVEKLFRRNKIAKIMIKAPHMYPEESVITSYQYDRISYEVFYELFDRVYYLNNIDSSLAEMPREIHPESVVVDAMVDQTLLYSCD
ncbi:Neurexophilin [Mactra antiquata]